MIRRYWLYLFLPLLIACMGITAWEFIRPRLTLWRVEGQVRKLLRGTLRHEGLVSEADGYLLLRPRVSGPRPMQANAMRISSDREEVVIIHPELYLDSFDLPIGSVRSPLNWHLIDGHLHWTKAVSDNGPIQPRRGTFVVNGSGDKEKSQLVLVSEDDGVIELSWDRHQLVVKLVQANLGVIHNWFPSTLALHPLMGRVDGSLRVNRSSEGWRLDSGSITLLGASLQIGDSGWLWQGSEGQFSIGGDQLVIKAEMAGKLIDPAGVIAWACSDFQWYLEEDTEGKLHVSGQGEETSTDHSRTFHISAEGQRSEFLGYWQSFLVRIQDREKAGFSEIALVHEPSHWLLKASHVRPPELRMVKEFFSQSYPWLADWTPIEGAIDFAANFSDGAFQFHARDLKVRHRWGRIEATADELKLTDSLLLSGGAVQVDGHSWSRDINGEWFGNDTGKVQAAEWSFEKKKPQRPGRLRWTGPIKTLFAFWKLDAEEKATLDTRVSLSGSNLVLNGHIQVADEAGKPHENAKFDLLLTVGDPIPMVRGTARIEQLPLGSYLKAFFSVSGQAQANVQFAGTTAKADFSVGQLTLRHPRFQFEADSLHGPNEIGHLNTLPAHLLLDWSEPSLQATIPVYGGKALDVQTGLEVSGLSAALKLNGNRVTAKHLEGYVEGLYFAGSAKGAVGAESHLDLALDSLSGTLQQVRAVLAKVQSGKNVVSKLPLDGKISLGNDGSWLRLAVGENGIQTSAVLCGTLFDGALNMRMGDMTVQDVNARFTYQYPTQTLFVDRILGTLLVGSGPKVEEYQLSGDHLRCMDPEGHELEFDLWVGDKARDILRVVASTESAQDCIIFHFDPTKTHLGQIHPSTLALSLRDLTQVDEFRLDFTCPLGIVWGDLKRVFHTRIFPLPRRLLREMDAVKAIEGQFAGNVNYDRKQSLFTYRFEADQLGINGHQLGKGAFVGSVQGDFWSIEQLTVGDLTLSADILLEATRSRVNFLGARLGGILLAGLQGDYTSETGKFAGQVNLFDLNLSKLRDWRVTRALARKASIKGELKGTGAIIATLPLSDSRAWHAEVHLDTNLRGFVIDDTAFQDIDNLKVVLSEDGISFKNGLTAIAKPGVALQWAELRFNPWRREYAADDLRFSMPTASVPWLFSLLNRWVPRDWSAVQTFLSGWGPNIEGVLKLSSDSSLTSAGIQLKDGVYRIGSRAYPLRNTMVEYSPYEFGITSRLDWSGRSLWVRLVSDSPRLNQGRLLLSGESPATWTTRQNKPLAVNWRRLPEGTLSLSDLKGSLWGVSVELRPKEGRVADGGLQFSGRVRAELGDLQDLLPEDLAKGLKQWQVKSALEISGDWKLSTNSAEGLSMKGSLAARNSQVMGYQWELAEATIKASPSQFTLQNLRLTDQAGAGTVPELSGTRLQDGRWLVSAPKLDLTAVTLNNVRRIGQSRRKNKKTLSLSQVHLTGIEGTLGDRFGWRGEGSVEFNYHTTEPTMAFGRISLGSDVAYPAMGKIDFQVHSGRIHLIRLKDVYNEGKMVKFYFPERSTPSTIGLDGSLNITVKVKPHHMLLKVMDKMTLNIAGTLKDPQCTVR